MARLNLLDSNDFGIKAYFAGRCHEGKYNDKDALYVHTKAGEKVILIAGGGKAGTAKIIKGLSIGMVACSEVNECDEEFVREMFDRTMASSCRKLFFDLNPKSELHWWYEIQDLQKQNYINDPSYGYNFAHLTIFQNMSLTDQQIKDILITYDRTSVWYLRDILGKRKNVEGLVYDCFKADNKYDPATEGPDYSLWNKRYYACDYGTINPFGSLEFIEQTIERETHYYVVDEFYYDSKKEHKQKDDYEYCDDMIEFIGDKKYQRIIIDPSAASFKLALRKKLLRPQEADPVINGDNEVLNGIRLVSSLLQAGRLHISIKCVNLIKELGSYMWDDKASLRGVEKVIKEHDHLCDVLRYLCKTIVKSYKI